jgi:hypothetical protein
MKLAERQQSPPVGFHIAARLKILGQEVGLPLGPLLFMLRWNEPDTWIEKEIAAVSRPERYGYV